MSHKYNKIIMNNNVLIDLTADTVTSETLLSGRVAHSSDGSIITGSYITDYFNYIIDNNDDIILDSSGNTLDGDIGYVSMSDYKSEIDRLEEIIDTYYRLINDYNILDAGFVLDSDYEKIQVDSIFET